MNEDAIYHVYQRPEIGREAVVYRNDKGFYVECSQDGAVVRKITCYEHSEIWAENTAENWVDEILNA